MALFKLFNKKADRKKPVHVKKHAKIKHVKVKHAKVKPAKAVKKEVRHVEVKPVKSLVSINKMPDEKAYELLKRYKIKVPDYQFCKSEKELPEAIKKIGFPMVMKVSGKDIVHKTDVSGVRLGICSVEEAKDAFSDLIKVKGAEKVLVQKMIKEGYEIIIGARKDPQFKTVVALGAGGIFTEFLKDVSFRVSPIEKEDAENMLMEVKFSELLLKGFRGQKPADKEAIVNTILSLSRLVDANPNIREVDLNPVFASSTDAIAADVRIILE
jgi:acyl-CoA synthetase (NDP forming)